MFAKNSLEKTSKENHVEATILVLLALKVDIFPQESTGDKWVTGSIFLRLLGE